MSADTKDRVEELKTRVDELETVRDKLIQALEATKTYAWEWDLETDKVERYPAFETLFGIEADELEPIFENFIDRVHTDYREDVVDAFETAIDEGSNYHVRYPLTLDEDEIWLEGEGEVQLDDAGEPVRIVGTTRQIPEPETA